MFYDFRHFFGFVNKVFFLFYYVKFFALNDDDVVSNLKPEKEWSKHFRIINFHEVSPVVSNSSIFC